MWQYVYDNPNKIGFITYTIIGVLIVAIIFIFFYFLTNKLQTPTTKTLYAVLPNTTATSLYICGTDSKSECVFTVNSLADAIGLCNKYLNICQQFTLSRDMTMRIVTDIVAASSTADMYIYQYPVQSVVTAP